MPNGTKSYKVGNDVYDIPDEKAASFLKSYPNAQEVQSYTVDKDTFDIPVPKVNDFIKAYLQAKPIGYDSKEVQQQDNGHSDSWNKMQAQMAKKAADAGLPHFDNGNDRLNDAINRSEKAGYGFNHFTNNNDPTGDRTVTIDIENLTKALQKRLSSEKDPTAKTSIAKELNYWQSELKDGMTAQEWKNQTGEADPIPQSNLQKTLQDYSATHQYSKNATMGYDNAFVPKGKSGGEIITNQEKAADEKLTKAAENTYNKTIGRGSHTKADSANYVNQLKQGVKNGDLGITQDAQGNDVIKNSGNFFQSFKAAADQAYAQDIENKYLRSIPKDEAISYLNRIQQKPETGIVKESDIAPNGLGELGGSQSQLIGKTTMGAMALGETGLTGGGSAGGFLAIANDLASSGYSQALKKNYYLLKQQGLSDSEAFDKATQAGLVGEAASLGTGVLLSGEINLMPKKATVQSVENLIKHTIKTTPKVVGSAGVGSVINDITTNAEANGNPIDKKQMLSNAEEAMKPMLLIHGALGALGAIANGQKTIVPSYARPQLENMAASADRNAVSTYLNQQEQKGEIPQGTTQKVLQKLNEFDAQKKVVENLPIPEENKAAITGKLIQKQDLLDEKASLKPNENALPKRIADIDKEISGIDGEINKFYDAKDIFQKEKDALTGEGGTQPKQFDELKKQEQDGIVVPKEYGATDVTEKGEGDTKTFTPKAFYIEKQGALEIKKNIPVDEKNFTDKDKAQAAADNALKQHYYENGLHDNAKPDKKITEEKNQTLVSGKNNETSNSENGRIASNEGGTNKEDAGKTLQPQQTEENGITVIKPEENIPNDNVTEVNSTENPKTNSVVEDKPEIKKVEDKTTNENIPPEPPKEEPPLNEGADENKVGISHAALTDVAKRLGLKEPERGKRLTPEQSAERGRKTLDAEPEIYKEVEESIKNDKQPTTDDVAVARAHFEDLIKNSDAIARDKGVDSPEYEGALKEVQRWSDEVVKPIGTKVSEPFTALQGERDLDTDSFTTVKRTIEDVTGKPVSKAQEQKIKDLTETNQKLKQQADEAEAKLIEETDKAFKAGVEEGKKKSNSEKAKSVANRLRESAKLHKPNSFSAATPASLAWDAAIEVVAKGIEAGGKLADVIEDGLNHIRNTDWYKSLTDDKKQVAEQDFKQFNNDNAGTNSLEDLQARFLNKKDNKFSIDEAKDVWAYMKENYLDKGTSYRDAISQVSNDLGLSWRQINDAIASPKTKRISDEMWNKQANYRRNQNATKTWVEQQDKSGAVKLLNKVSNAFRGVAVFGHGGIFVGTHAGATLFQPSTWSKTIPAFFRGWEFAYGNTAKYERAIEELKHRDNYVVAQRAGLKNNPDRLNAEEYQKSQKFLGKLGDAGERGFNAIKVLRQDLFDYHYNKLSDAEKQDPESAKSIARLINNATGATNLDIPKWVNDITFAGGMEAARWGKLTRNPIEATTTAIKALRNPANASTADKVFAKVWASRVGQQLATYATLLAANAAIQKVANPKNPTNLTDPSKYDWLRFKFGDNTLDPTSGMVSVINFIGSLIGDSIKSKKERHGDTVAQADYKNAGGYLRGKLSPAFGTLIDLKTGTDFSGNTLPYNSDKPQTGRDQISWLQYASEKLPLPVAEAFSVMYKSAQDNGMPKPNIENVIDGIAAGVISGTTGFRVGETKEKQEPFNEQDKKDPTFKYFLDKGLQLPNTSLSSEEITDEKSNTKKKISDYPKDVQDKYTSEHKLQLKNELQSIKNKNYVYVNTYKDADGKDVNEVATHKQNSKSKRVNLDNLSTDELAQVLHIAQTQATEKTKKKIFKK